MRRFTGFAAVQNALCQGFSGVNQAVVSQGYESRLGTQAAIQANTTQGVMNTNAIQQQVASCCCENEKQAMQTRFENQQNHCATMQAIDKVGDRIVDYLTNQETQRLRDENQYLTDTLRPCPSPAYITCNSWAGQPYGSCTGYGCGCGCN